ncbi:MAG: bifunctional 5,10-methylenetetrahydrofolate dehydrogenase/5,10-methenyltetrahydrofolate cyclohydrolase [Microthrixaceae bacterium]|nr:bifunctional 5,10-methylenetetrahydrofolate dehydrogenase/5,10-methenyltetrahydrofolate cyclohydrolase [Microthrixaceae bacterium]
MTAVKLDGEALATDLKQQMRARVERLTEQGYAPGLGTILVGDDGPSARYVGMKHKDCAEIGIHSVDRRLPNDATQAQVDDAIAELNNDPAVSAFIVQYPFPKGLDYGSALLKVDPAKDADGLHPTNLGLLVMGEDAPLACTPRGILHMLHSYDVPVAGKHVVVVGRGLTIGRPIANLLTLKRPDANAAVTVVHTGVADIGPFTRQADILIAAAGAPALITADMVKPGAAVVAAGVSIVDGKACSDVDDEVEDAAGWLSPRIGGVGPLTRAFLLLNTIEAAERAAGLSAV